MPVGNTGLHGTGSLRDGWASGPGRGWPGAGEAAPPPRAPSPVPLPQKLFPLQRSLTPGDCALWRPLAVGAGALLENSLPPPRPPQVRALRPAYLFGGNFLNRTF